MGLLENECINTSMIKVVAEMFGGWDEINCSFSFSPDNIIKDAMEKVFGNSGYKAVRVPESVFRIMETQK